MSLKEEFKNVGFGKLLLGVGTEETYTMNGNYNQFNKKTQFSVLSNWGNVNGAQSGGGGRGINQRKLAGFNLNQELSNKSSINLEYTYSSIKNELDKFIKSESFINSNTFTTSEFSNSNSSNQNHHVNLKFNWKPNKFSELVVLNETKFVNGASEFSATTNYLPVIDSNQNTSSERGSEEKNLNVNSTITYRRRFEKPKRNFKLSWNVSNFEEREDLGLVNNLFLTELVQIQEYNYSATKHVVSGTFTEPLGPKWVVQSKYKLSVKDGLTERLFYNVEPVGLVLDSDLSNLFQRNSVDNRASVLFRRNTKKSNYEVGSNVNHHKLESEGFSRNFEYITPFVSLKLRLKKASTFTIKYSTSTRLPTINQLKTIPNNENPNSVYVGNVNLEPEYNHKLKASLFRFNAKSGANLYGNVSLLSTSKKIVNQVTVNPDFTRSLSPENVSFFRRARVSSGIGVPFEKTNIRTKFSPSVTVSKSEIILNGINSTVNGVTYRSNFSVERLKYDKLNWVFGVGLNYTSSKFESNSSFDQGFFNYYYSTLITYKIKSDLVVTVNYRLNQFNDVFFSPSTIIHLLSVSAQQSINKNWSVSVLANDLFNANKGVIRSSDVNGFREENYNSLSQFYMVTISRNFKKH